MINPSLSIFRLYVVSSLLRLKDFRTAMYPGAYLTRFHAPLLLVYVAATWLFKVGTRERDINA